MAKETLIQFDSPRQASVCPSCGQHFSGDARFCPFDGEPLGADAEWDPDEDPLLGGVVDGRYQVEHVLGEGGMGTVYAVRHVTLGRRFALKALRRDLAQDSDLPPRFIQEAKAAAAVSHPNVVQITDFGTLPSGQPYFVMELLDGVPLSRVIRDGGPVPVQRAVGIAAQVAQALAAAHVAGVVHRDLKPDNIQVSPMGDRDLVKVLDFGLAKVAGGSRFTRAGMVFGTPHYMSPEQAAGEPSDHRVDVYALGIVLYEMLTGKLPFEADTFMGVLTKHIYMTPSLPSQVLGDARVLGPLEAVVMRCLEKKPDKRFASMDELLAELESAAGALGFSEAPISDAPTSRRSVPVVSSPAPTVIDSVQLPIVKRRFPPWVVVGGVLLLLVVVAAFGLGGQSSPAGAASASPVPSAPDTATPAEPIVSAADQPPESPQVEVSASAPAPAPEPPKAATGAAVPAPPAPSHSDKPPAQKPPKSGTFGGSEIVDPWGK
ncbi:MAG: protein kinase [Myxococcales bacterium]|nr:protein kinase [Myxococcales bacterium]MCB9577247.1 protein kinase [Polyangiaceae bacterium]